MSSRTSSIRKFGKVIAEDTDINKLQLDKVAVTQAVNITTAVTCDAAAGVITTQAASAGTDGSHTFTVNNSYVVSSSVVIVSICNYGGNGLPIVRTNAISNGSFTITISNPTGTALNAAMKIAFIVV